MRSRWGRGGPRLPAALLMAASVAAGLCVGAALHVLARMDTGGGMPPGSARAAGRLDVPRAPDCSVMLFGDSILYGAHNGLQRLGDPPAALLQRLRPRYEVMDHSHPGDSAQLHASRFRRTPLRGRIVVLQFGINDASQGKAYEPALRAMVRRVRAQGRIPVITGLSRVSEGQAQRDAHDRLARRIAQSTGTVFADWGAVRFDAADMADAVHPGQPYADRLTRQLVRALDRVAPECARPARAEAPLRLVSLHRTGSGLAADAALAPRALPLVAGTANSLRHRRPPCRGRCMRTRCRRRRTSGEN